MSREPRDRLALRRLAAAIGSRRLIRVIHLCGLDLAGGWGMSSYTYRLVQADGSFVAECVEIEAEGEGATAKAAVDSLRQAIKERMCATDAVAPPSMPPAPEVELVEAASPQRSVSPQGPGEKLPAR